MKTDEFLKEGAVSEWHEGNFKTLRLHEAQEMINYGKVNPFSIAEDEQAWKYQIWKAGIDILYGEGQSKYSDDEEKEVENIRDYIYRVLQVFPPFKTISETNYAGKKDRTIGINSNQEKIERILYLYEKKVKQLNDVHGLSTRNQEDDTKGL